MDLNAKKTKPCVFVVNDTYHIMVPVSAPSLMWVKVGDKLYYDESNGILKSQKLVHRMVVPMQELDEAGSYTVCERVLIERKPYFSETEELQEYTYSFHPVRSEQPRAYHIADAHNMVEEPIRAAKAYGAFDFLILNGDVPNDSGAIENFNGIYQIAYELTGGEKPIVFARGNHDLRGIYAECLEDYIPTDNGNTYYTFRLGSIWGLVLDCGEDKEDTHPEYGNTVCCHAFRERQTDFIKRVIQNAEKEYLQKEIKTRLVIVHNPFTEQTGEPFNIEETLYREWAQLIREHVKPHLMLCGHLHRLQISNPGDAHDSLGNPATVVSGSDIDTANHKFFGCGLAFEEEQIHVSFTSSDGEVIREEDISCKIKQKKPRHMRSFLITSNRPEKKTHKVTLSNTLCWLLVLLLCVVVGALLGTLYFESRQVLLIAEDMRTAQDEYDVLLGQYDELNIQNEQLAEQVQVLSDTINKRMLEDEAVAAAEAEQRVPSGFPVTGSVTEAEAPQEDNALEMAVYYNASETSVVVATGKGTVLSVRQNVYDNYEVQVDHGNGYVTVYTNAGYPIAEEGMQVLKGTPLFYIGEENTLVKYQVSLEGGLINAYDVMNIDG